MNNEIKEALRETYKRYPEAISGLTFFLAAANLNSGKITQDHLDWVDNIISNSEIKK